MMTGIPTQWLAELSSTYQRPLFVTTVSRKKQNQWMVWTPNGAQFNELTEEDKRYSQERFLWQFKEDRLRTSLSVANEIEKKWRFVFRIQSVLAIQRQFSLLTLQNLGESVMALRPEATSGRSELGQLWTVESAPQAADVAVIKPMAVGPEGEWVLMCEPLRRPEKNGLFLAHPWVISREDAEDAQWVFSLD